MLDLIDAAIKGDVRSVRTNLAQAGRRDYTGRTALMHAAKHGHYEIVSILRPLEGRLRDGTGRTALRYAIAGDHRQCTKLLLFERDIVDSDGKTAFDDVQYDQGVSQAIRDLLNVQEVLPTLPECFLGRYTITGIIKETELFTIYSIRDYMNRNRALKHITYGMCEEPIRRAIRNEIRLIPTLRHSRLLSYHETAIDEPATTAYFVMEWYGMSLADLLADGIEEGAFTDADVWRCIHQLSDGLRYLHSRHIIHRDLRPNNVLVTKLGDYLITNFSSIRPFEPGTLATTFIGRNTYMAPEMLTDEPCYSEPIDIWSLGVIAYEMCTGHHPFSDLSTIAYSAPTPIVDRPDDLIDLIASMLSKDPKERPTAKEVFEQASVGLSALSNSSNRSSKDSPSIKVHSNKPLESEKKTDKESDMESIPHLVDPTPIKETDILNLIELHSEPSVSQDIPSPRQSTPPLDTDQLQVRLNTRIQEIQNIISSLKQKVTSSRVTSASKRPGQLTGSRDDITSHVECKPQAAQTSPRTSEDATLQAEIRALEAELMEAQQELQRMKENEQVLNSQLADLTASNHLLQSENAQLARENQAIAKELQHSNAMLTSSGRNELPSTLSNVLGTSQQSSDQKDTKTALMHAAIRGDIKTVKLLAEREAQTKDEYGWTALMWAAYKGHEDCVSPLLSEQEYRSTSARTFPSGHSFSAGITAYGIAREMGYTRIAEVLSPNPNDESIHVPAISDEKDSAITASSVPKEVCNNGSQLIEAAIRGSVKDVVRLMDLAGTRDNNGKTALMHAAEQGNVDCVRALIAVEGRLQDNIGRTALMYAVRNCHSRCVCLLLDEVDVLTYSGESVLYQVIRQLNDSTERTRGQLENIQRMLLKSGSGPLSPSH
ncbi:Kinase, NEK [Giardia muris]|uniref:Kinase, NEK n=1 Tax=Giardia muris TaxID=5742 RepID=A0A4Z1TAF6_GIAMU|nr:Kinase, NEK [Giardia muris]|eukprot:TNJ30207.1 Kinase, NEK [Giardia muris]